MRCEHDSKYPLPAGLLNSWVKRSGTERIFAETLKGFVKVRDVRLFNSPNYHNLRGEVATSAKSDGKRFWGEIVNRRITAALTGDFGKLFRLIRFSSGEVQPPSTLRNSGRHLISRCEQKLQR